MRNGNLIPAMQCHLWEVWIGEHNEIRGRIIDEWRPSQLPGLYEYNYKIEGRAHVYFISSHDAITREQAVFFAKEEYKGKLRRLSIDVSANHR